MRKKKGNFKRFRVVGIGATLFLVMVLAGFGWEDVTLAAGETEYRNGWDDDLKRVSGEATGSSVEITMGTETGNVKLNAKDPNKMQGMIKKTVSVELGATDGYTIKVSGNPNLSSGSNTIPGVSSATTLGQMNNRWGWYYADGNADCSELASYKGMTSAGETVSSGKLSEATTKILTMCFGAKIDASQPGGNYSNTVMISAVAQPKTVTTFGVTTMQEMTAEICSAAAENDTDYLRDARDGKYYWVTKMKDGNCWMSQNLALDLSTSTALTSADSDVASSWAPEHNTTNKVTDGSTTNTDTWSWNLGTYVLNTPTATTACSSNNTGLSACSGQGFVNVSGWTASTDPNFYRATNYTGTDGSSCSKTANSAANASASGGCRIYDAHYLVGNYYQWNAATAGTGGTIVGENASGSICPKGWKLPNSGDADDLKTSGSFYYLLNSYGVSSSLVGNVAYSPSLSFIRVQYNVALSPLFFVRGGDVWSGQSNPFEYAGQRGFYWSSRAYSSTTDAYNLNFGSSSVNPSSNLNRYLGFSLRCLIPTT